jgi:hypothetical protein
MCLPDYGSGSVSLVADVLELVDGLAVQRLLNGDVGHGRGRRRAVPMFLAGLEPHDITRSNFLDWSALALNSAAARRDDQELAKRMSMPCGASAGFERDRVAGRARRSVCLEQRVDAQRCR